jgi:uncharacterized protein
MVTDTPPQAGDPTVQAVDDESPLTRLHPNYRTALRIRATIAAIPLAVAGFVADQALLQINPLPFGVLVGFTVFAALVLVIRLPARRYGARGFQLSNDRLRVVRGILWRADTVVPFGRVQHIDVNQGPLDRALGIATLTVHTAGNHNASVSLPGLGLDFANEMRETIRSHIRRESM